MTDPLVTVITPTHNCGRYLAETVESVLSQSYRNIQYIVLDDGSTDETQRILERYRVGIFRDTRLTLIHQVNRGEHKTVNQALGMVQGDYFMIVNADDPLLPNAITILVAFMEHACDQDVLCGYPDWNCIREDGGFDHAVESKPYDFIHMLSHHECLPSVGSIFRSSVVELVGFRDETFPFVGDFDYWLRVGLVGDMAHVPKTLATWRNRRGQASRKHSDARAEEHVRLIRKFLTAPLNQLFTPVAVADRCSNSHITTTKFYAALMAREAMCWAYLVAGSISGSPFTACGHFIRAITMYPRVLKEIQTYQMVAKRLLHAWRKG